MTLFSFLKAGQGVILKYMNPKNLTMKRLLLSVFTLCLSTHLWAQNLVGSQQITQGEIIELDFSTSSVAGGAYDTLGLDDFGTSLVAYTDPSGYVSGTSDYFDSQLNVHQYQYDFARGFLSNTTHNIAGALIFFSNMAPGSANPDDMYLRLYSIGQNLGFYSAASQTPDYQAPDQQLSSISIPFNNAQNNSLTTVLFSSSFLVNGDFAMSVDIQDLYDAPIDTISILSDMAGSSDGENAWIEYGFDITPTTLWVRASGAYDDFFDTNFGIFPLVEDVTTRLEEQGFLNGVKMTSYPNPAVSSDIIRVQYGLENAAEKVEVNVYDMNGKLIFSHVEGDRAAGIHTIDIPVGTLTAGSYVYSLQANGGRMAKQLQILK